VKVINSLQASSSCFQSSHCSSALVFGCEACFFFDCFFCFFVLNTTKGVLFVCFAYASLVFFHTKKLISKDKHCDCIDHHLYANNKDILVID
jgi:hypothetical protein